MRSHLILFVSVLLSVAINAQVYVDQDATGNNDGTSWADAYTNLQMAIDSAATGDQLWIAEGLYIPQASPSPDSNWFAVLTALEFYGGFEGTETSLDQRNWVENPVILSGDVNGDDVNSDFDNFRDDNARHVMRVAVLNGLTILDGLIITNGHALAAEMIPDTANVSDYRGGGLELISTAEIRNCRFRQCHGSFGSAIWAVPVGTSTNELVLENSTIEFNHSFQGAVSILGMNNPVVSNCHFEGNTAVTFGGGLTLSNTNALIEDCTFEDNVVPELIGGGIYIFQNSANLILDPVIEINRCDFLENNGLYGGGLAYNNVYPNASIVIDSCYFYQNESSNMIDDGVGGGVLIQNLADNVGGGFPTLSATISNCTFEENEAFLGGAAFVFSNSETVDYTFSKTVFLNNTSFEFAGAVNVGNARASIEDCVFDGNESINSIGGGIFFWVNSFNTDPDPGFEIRRTEFVNNVAPFGSGLAFNNFYSSGSMIIDSCLFSQNSHPDNFDGAGGGLLIQNIDGGGPVTGFPVLNITLSNSLIEDNSSGDGGGAYIYSAYVDELLQISNTDFVGNSATGNGGALVIDNDVNINAVLQNNRFTENSANDEGAAIVALNANEVLLENVLLNDNTGAATIYNDGNLVLRNVTMVDNAIGLSQDANGNTEMQNTILNNTDVDYTEVGSPIVTTKGGNVCSDTTLNDQLTGFEVYADFVETDPLLDANYVPTENSVCIDAGNSDGITAPFDLAGAERIQGVSIDAGAFESPFTTSIKDPGGRLIHVFPNPFADHLTFSDIEGVTSIRLLTISGREVQSFVVEPSLSVNNNLPSGTYLLEVGFGDTLMVEKLEKR